MTDKPTIQCAKNGPLLAKGLTQLNRIDGSTIQTEAVAALCRCGASANKPFCDGAHAAKSFDDSKSDERTPDSRADYVGKEVTIHDNRGICAHAAFCTERAPAVFRMKQEPWIDPDGASLADVIEVVESCPSGALSYTIGDVEHRDREGEPSVLVAPGGPYAIKGGVELEGVEWGEGASKEHYDLCRCGGSKNKPFCDGAHWGVQFDG